MVHVRIAQLIKELEDLASNVFLINALTYRNYYQMAPVTNAKLISELKRTEKNVDRTFVMKDNSYWKMVPAKTVYHTPGHQ